MDDPDLAASRRRLAESLERLREASRASADERKPVTLDQSSVGRLSRMDSMQMQEMALAAERRRKMEIERIEAAIRRLDAGDYGYCVICDEPIAPKRLAADPAAAACIRCAGRSGRTP